MTSAVKRRYACLKGSQEFSLDDFSLVPIRDEDRYQIMRWRNEQMYHLRQSERLTKEKQDHYFEQVIGQLFEQEKPDQILFSFLQDGKRIGYGGLVHINWLDQHAEISFIMATELEAEHFERNWKVFLKLIQTVAFEELNMHKIFTYAFDMRTKLYPIFEDLNFSQEARLREHVLFAEKRYDVVIHSKLNTK